MFVNKIIVEPIKFGIVRETSAPSGVGGGIGAVVSSGSGHGAEGVPRVPRVVALRDRAFVGIPKILADVKSDCIETLCGVDLCWLSSVAAIPTPRP